MLLPQLPQDKANHALYGALICASCHWAIGPWALIPVIIAAVGKELYDLYTGKGNGEILDAVCTVAGGAIVLL